MKSRLILSAVCLLPALSCSWPGKTALVLSNLKSPLRLATHRIDPESQPLDRGMFEKLGVTRSPVDGATRDSWVRSVDEMCDPPSEAARRRDCVDDFADLEGRSALVVVAISGGGARSARLAAHAMAGLESRLRELGGGEPLIDQIDAFSTVSGGSIYAYHVARAAGATPPAGFSRIQSQDRGPGPRRVEAGEALFARLAAGRRVRAGTEHLGALAFQSVIGPLALSLAVGPFLDWSFVDHLANGLETSQSGNFWDAFLPFDVRAPLLMSDLPPRPRFLFNATALETGHPFVFTQRILNARPQRISARSARLDRLPPLPHPNDDPDRKWRRPLRSAWTLEDFGSSPANFPVAYAAAASAAFPIGVEPLPLLKYQVLDGEVQRTHDVVSLSDGGVWSTSTSTG